jgi:hypothetical protein
MSCDAIAFSAMLMFASFTPDAQAGATPAVIQQGQPPASVASEPLFADIVQRAGGLKAQTEAYRAGLPTDPTAAAQPLTGLDGYLRGIGELSALDMKGHVTLKERGAVDDLKCILRGISQDLPEKLTGILGAKTVKDQDLALRDMIYLLNDNVEVITAPPRPAA